MTIPLRMLAEPAGDELAALSDAEREVLSELRRKVSRAEYMHPEFDPRAVLRLSAGLSAGQVQRWQKRRLKWLRKVFADDPRVAA